MRIEDLVALLTPSLSAPAIDADAISRFQSALWGSEHDGPGPAEAWEALRDLAYDLDYFEPDPQARAEDASFLNVAQAQHEIRATLQKLGRLGITISTESKAG